MIQHPLFSFDFDPRWQMLSGDGSHAFSFHDIERSLSIALDACIAELDTASIEHFTKALIESRLLQENAIAAALGRPATIYEPIVIPYPWGRAIAYYGHDDAGRQFSFSGNVTGHGAISLTLTSGSLSEHELLAAMDELNRRIQFDRTLLPHQT